MTPDPGRQDAVEPVARPAPETPAAPRADRFEAASRRRAGRRHRADRLARRIVTLGGLAIIASILLLLVVIAVEILPLFRPPSASPAGEAASGAAGEIVAVSVDEYRETAAVVTAAGVVGVPLSGGGSPTVTPLPDLGGAKIVAASSPVQGALVFGLSDGRIVPVRTGFRTMFDGETRRVVPESSVGPVVDALSGGTPVRAAAFLPTEDGWIAAAFAASGDGVLVAARKGRSLVGPPKETVTRRPLAAGGYGEPTAAILDKRVENLFVGTASGAVLRFDLRMKDEPRPAELVPATVRGTAAVTVLGFLIGDRTLVVGDAAGGVSSWQALAVDDAGTQRMRRVNGFRPHRGPVTLFSPSGRNKGFLTGDASGVVRIHYGTTGETRLEVAAGATRALVYAPKADGLVTAGGDGRLRNWTVNDPHPEVTWRGLFGKLWYEGYPEPAYVWQSTGGSDDSESKLCLVPLIIGTLKGTLYALLFAVPIALLAALYTSQFMHPGLRAWVKPTIELMAALPSVVLGLIAGLWLAPRVERIVPGIFLMAPCIAALALAGAVVWRRLPPAFRGRFRSGEEMALLIPLTAAGVLLAVWAGTQVEALALGGDFRTWVRETVGLTFDQRNSLVVGFAMGFAVIPLIFTISEDSLSNVPPHLPAGSLALGASRWQTALRVVLPTASPGIFSAVMIGLGRAVGETMIVVMATGNTPVMDWSLFNGFRALSANIAVEMSEAPEGGSLFRVLFVAAGLLFAMTFLVNTAAELVRLRLRRRYSHL